MIERATRLHFEITFDDRLMAVLVRAPLGATGGTPEIDPLAGDHGDPAFRKHLPGRFPDCWHVEDQVAHLYGFLLPEVRQQSGVEGVDGDVRRRPDGSIGPRPLLRPWGAPDWRGSPNVCLPIPMLRKAGSLWSPARRIDFRRATSRTERRAKLGPGPWHGR